MQINISRQEIAAIVEALQIAEDSIFLSSGQCGIRPDEREKMYSFIEIIKQLRDTFSKEVY